MERRKSSLPGIPITTKPAVTYTQEARPTVTTAVLRLGASIHRQRRGLGQGLSSILDHLARTGGYFSRLLRCSIFSLCILEAVFENYVWYIDDFTEISGQIQILISLLVVKTELTPYNLAPRTTSQTSDHSISPNQNSSLPSVFPNK